MKIVFVIVVFIVCFFVSLCCKSVGVVFKVVVAVLTAMVLFVVFVCLLVGVFGAC